MTQQEDIRKATEILHKGGVILYPTDTIWGLGCVATSAEAIDRIFEIKQRPQQKAMLALVSSIEMLKQYVAEVPQAALDLIGNTQRPLTIIYNGARNLATNLPAPEGTIGIRLVQEPFCAELINQLGCPLVSTSANISGQPSPAFYKQIDQSVVNAVDYSIRHRQNDTTPSQPSMLVRLHGDGQVEILRK